MTGFCASASDGVVAGLSAYSEQSRRTTLRAWRRNSLNVVPAQLVDATPSHRNDFLKVVFMAQGKRNRLSAEQRVDMWRRWKAGESLHEIGRAFGKGHGSIQFLLTLRGGIVPAVRRRSPRTLTPAERADISRGHASGSSIREIAKGLHPAAPTLCPAVAPHARPPPHPPTA